MNDKNAETDIGVPPKVQKSKISQSTKSSDLFETFILKKKELVNRLILPYIPF